MRYAFLKGDMTMSFVKTIIVTLFVVSLAGCANTIRGVGADTANAVDATVDATNNVANSAN